MQHYDVIIAEWIHHVITHWSSTEKALPDGIVFRALNCWLPCQPACLLSACAFSPAAQLCLPFGSELSAAWPECLYHYQDLLTSTVHCLMCFHVNTHTTWCLFRTSFVKQLGMEESALLFLLPTQHRSTQHICYLHTAVGDGGRGGKWKRKGLHLVSDNPYLWECCLHVPQRLQPDWASDPSCPLLQAWRTLGPSLCSSITILLA